MSAKILVEPPAHLEGDKKLFRRKSRSLPSSDIVVDCKRGIAAWADVDSGPRIEYYSDGTRWNRADLCKHRVPVLRQTKPRVEPASGFVPVTPESLRKHASVAHVEAFVD